MMEIQMKIHGIFFCFSLPQSTRSPGRRVARKSGSSDDEASGVHELFRSEKSREVLREFPEMGVP